MAYSSKKSHNYKSPIEIEDPVNEEYESEDQEEAPVTPSIKAKNPAKQYKSELEDAADYGAYKLAGFNSDVEDYDEPKFAHLKVEPKNGQHIKTGFKALPESQFRTRNFNEALTDFKTKDWSKCKKVIKDDMTCYYCKDAKGATQEECVSISSTKPKNAGPTKIMKIIKSAPFMLSPVTPKGHERFARLRLDKPLKPTKASYTKAEPLVTPKTITDPSYKKTIKRTVTYKKKTSEGQSVPKDSRASAFEMHVLHE